MLSYINKSVQKIEKDVSSGVTSPDTNGLLDVTEVAEKLIEEKDETFHLTVAKI